MGQGKVLIMKDAAIPLLLGTLGAGAISYLLFLAGEPRAVWLWEMILS